MSHSLSPSEGARLVNREKLSPAAELHSVAAVGERNPQREDASSRNRKDPRRRSSPPQAEDRVELSEDARGEMQNALSKEDTHPVEEGRASEAPLLTHFQAKV